MPNSNTFQGQLQPRVGKQTAVFELWQLLENQIDQEWSKKKNAALEWETAAAVSKQIQSSGRRNFSNGANPSWAQEHQSCSAGSRGHQLGTTHGLLN